MKVIYTSLVDPSVTLYEIVQRIVVKTSKKVLSTVIEITIVRFDGSEQLVYRGPEHTTLQVMLTEPKFTQINLVGYNKTNELIKSR